MTHPSGEAAAPKVRIPRIAAAVAAAALLCHSAAAPASPSHASASSTSRWWKLDCGQRPPRAATPGSECVFSVRLRGRLDRSRLRLIEHAIERRDAAAQALRRDVALHVDVDSPGGEVFAGMEIGRRLRRARASLSVAEGSACISACVFALMGAVASNVAGGARVGVHRPSLGTHEADPLVGSLSGAILLYADEMNVSREMIDDMMAVPTDRIRFLDAADLARYGIAGSGGKGTP